MKILLVGMGAWGSKHSRILQSLPGEFFYSDLDPTRLNGLPNASTNFRDFLPEAEGAIIATPAPTHLSIAREFLAAGKDVFVEKPLAVTADECRQLMDLATARERILQVGHIFRFEPASRWLRDAVRAGRFGNIRLLRGCFRGFKRPRPDGGSLFSDGVHFVDLFNFLLDTTPRRVQAWQRDLLGRGMDDVSVVGLEYQMPFGMVWATVETDYFTPGKHREVVVVGDRESAVCDYTAKPCQIVTHENRHHNGGTTVGAVAPVATPGEEPLRAELLAFLNSVATRQPPEAGGAAGLHAVRIMEAAVQSARSGGSLIAL